MKTRHTLRTSRAVSALVLSTSLALPFAALAQPAQTGPGATGTQDAPGNRGAATAPAMQNNQAGTGANANRAGESRLDRADRDFIERAAHSGHAEVEASRLAAQKARSPQVKAFAEQMVKDHTATNEELATLARARGVTPPTEPSLVQKGKQKLLLETADGEDFDRRYAESMGIEAHRDTIALFEKASRDAKDPELRSFAANKLPALRHHLEMAQQLPQNAAKKSK